MTPLDLPPAFEQTVVDVHGEAGRVWLDALPELIETATRRWGLTALETLPLSYRFVASARRNDGAACVLKLAPIGDAELRREAAFLDLADGVGAVRLLDEDPSAGALLLERAVPGDAAAQLVPDQDAAATDALATVLRMLWRPAPATGFPSVEAFVADLGAYQRTHGADGPLGLLATAALEVAEDLLAAEQPAVLLHGDLHHDNVMWSPRGWLAIDPKGYVGPAAFDCGAALHNPLDHVRDTDHLDSLLDRRCDQLAAALDLARDAVVAWGFVHAVLSEVWALDDHGGVHGGPLRVAQALLTRLESDGFQP